MDRPLGAGDLSVIIPTRDRWKILGRTLAGLRAQRLQGFEVVVVVDGTDQAVPDLDGVRTVSVPHGGPGAARNAGACETSRPLILFLGDDMVPDPDLVARHLVAHRRHPEEESAVLGQVTWHPEVARTPIARWLDRSGSQFDFAGITGPEAGFGRFYSCNLSLKRRFFLDVGGFDQAFSYYYEDLDCGYRLGEKGMTLWYEPGAVARHLHRYDLAGLQRRFGGVAEGEYTMAALHPWFEPWFLPRLLAAQQAPPVHPGWARLVDQVPAGCEGLQALAERRSDRWYRQQLAPAFSAGWAAAEDLAELRQYLGDQYDHSRLVHHAEGVDHERDSAPDEDTFYRTSRNYLYDLTAFSMSGTKAPYLAELRAALAPGARVLDYGCGIGADGLRLAAGGCQVSFADFANPSTEYLRWRLARRRLDCPVYDLDRDRVPGGFDAAYSFDVIEHVDDPWAFLAQLETRAALVMVNLLEEDHGDTDLHRPLPIAQLLDHAERCGLVRYRRYHGRSHLILYRSPVVAGPPETGGSPDLGERWQRARSWTERHLGGHRRGRTGWYPVPRP